MNKGSEWSKWDLHIHTPYSHLNNKYNCSIDELAKKINEKQIKVVGVTNYFLVEDQEYTELKAALSSCYVIPNFEFRINEKNKDGEYINVHVLFNPETTTISKIHETLSRIELTNIGGGVSEYCTLANVKKLGAEKITISFADLCSQLKKDFKIVQDYLIVGVNKGYGGFCPGGKPRDQELAAKIDSLSHLIFSKKEDRDFFLNKINGRKELGLLPKPVFEASDAHTIDDIGKQFSWVKAEHTFEGLKQTLYEPEYRILISDQQPREPIRKIESIKFNFPKNSVIKRSSSSQDQELCIKHLKDEIFFSPYFTSIIGGRGTGKSTIINILAEKLGVRTEFFSKTSNSIYVDNKPLEIENLSQDVIDVKGTGEIEFISQGKVEKLAEGDELTNLVFKERIKDIENEFHVLDKQLEVSSQLLVSNIQLFSDFKKLSETLREKEKEQSVLQKIIDSINDDRYKGITKRINDINTQLSLIDSSRKQYETLLKTLKSTIAETILNNDNNDYENRITEILDTLKSIEEIDTSTEQVIIKLKEFNPTQDKIKTLTEELVKANLDLKLFFQEKGTSEESIKDSQNASENIARILQEIESLKGRTNSLRNRINENIASASNMKELYSKTETLVAKSVTNINEKLRTKNDNVLEIRFAFEFNKDAFKTGLFEEFYNTFKQYVLPNTSYDYIREVLFLVEPNEVLLDLNFKEFSAKINAAIDEKAYKRSNNYVTVITNIFASNINYMIYKMLLQKHLYNLPNYVKIKGFYGDRELSSSSFGQRCTAVIVTLLMTGVKPLVIDEPEAHLDNKLIADYLVDLIKEKKLDRQIIYATHNSNFVINGDSELIHILEIPDNSIYTNITSTTIENLSNRLKLLKLEGGKAAFLSRENKYGLYNNF